MRDVSEVVDAYGGYSRAVLEYCLTTKRLVDEAKQPGFSTSSWAPLAAFIDTEAFVRVGNFKEVMDWQSYVDFLTNWATSSDWECSFKRITEVGNVVFLELEERSRAGDFKNSVNSMSVYEFNDADKITRIDVYLQMALPSANMLKSYEGVQITE